MHERPEVTRLVGTAEEPPRFCPRCGASAGEGADRRLCSECGEALQAQGYCPVCEGYWPRPAGAFCPKHEIPLDEAAPPRMVTPHLSDLVTVGTFANALAAEAPRLRLESEGIPSFLQGERMGSQSMYQVATGGVKLQVPRDLAADARILLAQSWELPGAEEDLDDAWDDLAPEPGARRRAVMRGLIVFFLVAPLLMVILSWLFEALGGR